LEDDTEFPQAGGAMQKTCKIVSLKLQRGALG